MSDSKVIEKRAEQWARSNLIEGSTLKYEDAVEFGKVMYLDAHDLLDHKVTALKAQLSAYQEANKKDEDIKAKQAKQIRALKKELKACYDELDVGSADRELLEDDNE